MASASSAIAARTMSATLRLWPRCTTSAPPDCSSRRIMLMAASWPSNSDAAETNRSGLPGSGGFMLLAGKMRYRRVTRDAAPAMANPPARARPRRERPLPASPWELRRRMAHDRALKRDAVILAAARAFRARGYHNTSLDDLAASLKVTKPTLYLYVRNKEAMLF